MDTTFYGDTIQFTSAGNDTVILQANNGKIYLNGVSEIIYSGDSPVVGVTQTSTDIDLVGNDCAGKITYIVDDSAVPSIQQIAVTFNKERIVAPIVTITPGNLKAASTSNNAYVTTTTTGFSIFLAAGTQAVDDTLVFYYHVAAL